MQTATVTDFRKDIADTLNRVAYAKEIVAIERSGKVIAVVLPIEEYERLKRAARVRKG
jgi:prevent-host-death family protein